MRLEVISEHVRESIAAVVPPVGIQLAAVDAAGVKVPWTWGRTLAGQLGPSVRGQVTSEEVRLSFHAVVALQENFVTGWEGIREYNRTQNEIKQNGNRQLVD